MAKEKFQLTKKHIWGAVGVVLLLGAAVGVGVLARWLQEAQVKKITDSETSTVLQKVQDTQKQVLEGDYTGARAALDSALANDQLSTDNRYRLIMEKATVYENEKKYDEAIATYKEAGALKETLDVAECLGRVLEAKGDKQGAIEYYKMAKSRVADTYPLADADRERYDSLIKNLGGQP